MSMALRKSKNLIFFLYLLVVLYPNGKLKSQKKELLLPHQNVFSSDICLSDNNKFAKETRK